MQNLVARDIQVRLKDVVLHRSGLKLYEQGEAEHTKHISCTLIFVIYWKYCQAALFNNLSSMILLPGYFFILGATESDTNTFVKVDLEQDLPWNVFHCSYKEMGIKLKYLYSLFDMANLYFARLCGEWNYVK